MSVLGIGIDLVEVESFSRQLSLPGTSFAVGTFTAAELAGADQVARSAHNYSGARSRNLAARFAAKEAFIKAWSSARMGKAPMMSGVNWLHLEVRKDSWDRPSLHLSGETAEAFASSLGDVTVSLSLSHDDSMATAMVVIGAIGAPVGGPK